MENRFEKYYTKLKINNFQDESKLKGMCNQTHCLKVFVY